MGNYPRFLGHRIMTLIYVKILLNNQFAIDHLVLRPTCSFLRSYRMPPQAILLKAFWKSSFFKKKAMPRPSCLKNCIRQIWLSNIDLHNLHTSSILIFSWKVRSFSLLNFTKLDCHNFRNHLKHRNWRRGRKLI